MLSTQPTQEQLESTSCTHLAYCESFPGKVE